MMTNSHKPLGDALYSWVEDLLNALTHGIGAVFGIVALVLMVVRAAMIGDVGAIASVSIYGASFILLFLISTIYHAVWHQRARGWLKIMDHSAIYLLIAGTYTPFIILGLEGGLRLTMLVAIWCLAAFGVLFKFLFIHRFKKLALITYLGMGWLSVLIIQPLMATMPSGGLWMLAIGGLVYSLGVIFYVAKRIPYSHAIWHVFVLGGAVCHFVAVYAFVLPAQAV